MSEGGDELVISEEDWISQNISCVGLSDADVRDGRNEWVDKWEKIAINMWQNKE